MADLNQEVTRSFKLGVEVRESSLKPPQPWREFRIRKLARFALQQASLSSQKKSVIF